MTNIVKDMFGGGGGDQTALGSSGGINGLIDKFDAVGLGDKARSWIGDGSKEPVTGPEVREALGDPQVEQIAEKAHMPPDKASDGLASILPETVSKLTPGGQIPDAGQLQSMMKNIPGI